MLLAAGMTNMRLLSAALALGMAIGGAAITSGCREKGPAEKAGEKVDHAIDKVDDAVNPKGPAEKAGRAVDRAVDDVKK